MLKNKGITLIALVVTIVVLLILAGVSITAVFGENGIISGAKKAKEKTDEAVKNEISSIGELEDSLHETQTGIVVEKVIDSAPGKLEESEGENTYTINSIEDLVVFAYNVTTGTNNYEGKTVKLGLSLDFNSTKSYVDANRTDYGKYGYEGNLKTLLTTGEGFKTIGITTEDNKEKNFAGTFDGNGNFINGLYINKNNEELYEKIGLFSKNYGTIQNLKLLNINIYASEKQAYVAGICGQNTMSGEIQNCIVSGKIKNSSRSGYAGGITCFSSGKIIKCGNQANIEFDAENDGVNMISCGGVCSGNGGAVTECYNIGNINLNSRTATDIRPCIGGVVGINKGTVSNCYNIENISASSVGGLNIGGVAGTVYDVGKINNCYNVGVINGNGIEPKVGSLIGLINEGCSVSNCYYSEKSSNNGFEIDGSNKAEVVKMTETEMKLTDFVTKLNEENEENKEVWKQDTEGINKGFPILKWQQP